VFDDAELCSMLSGVRNSSLRLAKLCAVTYFNPEIAKTEPVGCARIPIEEADEPVVIRSLEVARERAQHQINALTFGSSVVAARCCTR
jgi:hypothetical protein